MKQATGAPSPESSKPLAHGAASASPASPTPSPCAEEAALGTQSLDGGFSNVVSRVLAGEEGGPASGSPLCLSLCSSDTANTGTVTVLRAVWCCLSYDR